MDIRDFDGVFKYKFIMPALYIISWIAMFAGPTFFPVIYQRFAILAIGYLVLKVVSLSIIMGWINIGGYKIRNKMEQREKNGAPMMVGTEDLKYGFIIPNYKE